MFVLKLVFVFFCYKISQASEGDEKRMKEVHLKSGKRTILVETTSVVCCAQIPGQMDSPADGANNKILIRVSYSQPESFAGSSGYLDRTGSFYADKVPASGSPCSTRSLDHISIVQPRLTGALPPPSGTLEENLGSFIRSVTQSDAARWSQSCSLTTPAALDGKKGSLLRCKTTSNDINTTRTMPIEGKINCNVVKTR